MTTENRIRLTESTDARNARMFRKFRDAADNFARHVALIEWQDRADAPKFIAWQEGPAGYALRVANGVAGYERNILEAADAAR